jgi:hypothetical protein
MSQPVNTACVQQETYLLHWHTIWICLQKKKTPTYISLKLNPRFKNKCLIWTPQFYVVILLSSNEEKVSQMVGGLWALYCSFRGRLSFSVTTAMMCITEKSWRCFQHEEYMQVVLGNCLPFFSLQDNIYNIYNN